MSDRKESSVLFSLRELRNIEEDRIREEEHAAKSREAERVRAQTEAERRAREEQEAHRRAVENAERAAREAQERQQREEQLRLDEAERRARVEAQARIEQDRLAREMEIRAVEAQKKRPTWLIALAGLLVIGVGSLGYVAWQNQKERDLVEKQAAEQIAALELQIDQAQEKIDRIDSEIDQKLKELLVEKDEERLAAIKAHIAAAQAAKKEAAEELADLRQGARPSGKKPDKGSNTIKSSNCPPDDPLCGL